ncbi:uncharacterized protein LOC143306052 [Osmia lignaria lignaria]|uniref:uncharacterized protein LOC143306052 n=1 Tax=Osmia lignaria lignaria TaxID=1437193 RepID=UPI00402BAB46
MLVSLAKSIKTLKSNQGIIVMGDFNSRSPLWGSDKWCSRGRILFQFCNSVDLLPTVTKGGATCDRGSGSKIDIMICNKLALQDLHDSVVIGDYSASDHRYLLHAYHMKQTVVGGTSPFELKKGVLDEKNFVKTFLNKYGDENYDKIARTDTTLEVDRFVDDINKMVNKHTRYTGLSKNNRTPVPWWNNEIAEKRAAANRARRKYTRDKARTDHDTIEISWKEFKRCKSELNLVIRKFKRDSWATLLKEVDADIWGRPYKLVTRTIKNKTTRPDVLNEKEVDEVVKKLFILNPENVSDQENESTYTKEKRGRIRT